MGVQRYYFFPNAAIFLKKFAYYQREKQPLAGRFAM